MAEPTIADNRLDVEAAPSWFRTAAAAFKYNNLVGAALSSETMYESLFPSDNTPASDEDILQSVRDNGLEGEVAHFSRIKTRGELVAMTNQIRNEKQHRQTMELASGLDNFTSNMLAGVLDLPSLLTGPAAGEALAARGFGRLVQSAGAAAAAGVTQTVAQEVGLTAIQQTRSPLESATNIAGAAVGGMILGPAFTKLFGRTTTQKLGTGIRDEVADMASGRMEQTVQKSVDDFIDTVHAAAGDDVPAPRVADGPDGIMQAIREQSAPPSETPTSPKPADPTTPAPTEKPVNPRSLRQDERAVMTAVGGHITPSEYAIIKKIADDITAEGPDVVTPGEILASLPKADTVDFQHAPNLGMVKAVRMVTKIAGGNPVLDLSVSPSTVAREAIWNFANMKSAPAGRESPTQVMSIVQRVYGEQGVAKDAILNAHRDWYRDVAKGFRVMPRQYDNEFGLDRFSELVFNAAVFGKEPHLHPDPTIAQAIQHPAIQKAAAAYRKFDDFIASESVRSGLLREGHKVPDHMRHVYAAQTILGDKERFVASEKLAAEQRVLGNQIAEADSALAARKVELDDFVTNGLDAAIEEVATQLAKTEQLGVDEVIRKTMVKRMQIADRQTHGLRLGRELDRIEAANTRGKEAERNKLSKLLKSRRWKALDPVEQEAATNQLASLDARWTTKLEELQAAAERKFDAEAEIAAREVESRTDKWVTGEMAKLRRAIERTGTKLESKAVKEIEKYYRRELAKAKSAHTKSTGAEARLEIREWAGQHANGVFEAIVYGETGAGGSHGRLTGGNIRGGNKARNVYMDTRELASEGWLNPDLFVVMDKMARQDGVDAVLARKFRRAPTEAEQRLALRNHPEAYWLDGQDKATVPDLDMRGVKDRMRVEYDEMVDAAKGDLPERLRLVESRITDIENLDDVVSIARGTHATDTANAALRRHTGTVKAAQFMWYMGKNTLTNIADTTKLLLVHGVAEPMAYMALRMRERLGDTFSANATLNEAGRNELREFASAVNVGLEHVNMSRLVYSTDVGDPFASAIRTHKADRWSAMMTQMGSKAFLIGWTNDVMKTAAFGIAQHRLGKMALDGKSITDLPLADRNWLQYIGMNDGLMKELAEELVAQNKSYTPGKPVRWDVREMHPDLQDRLVAVLHKDNSTTILSPDALSKLKLLRNPILDLMTQFSTFAVESGMGTMNLLGQRLRTGEIAAPTAGVIAMLSAAYITQAMSIYSDGKPDTIRRFNEAQQTNPGFFWYTMLDRSGLLGPFAYLSSRTDDALGIGMQSLARRIGGDDLKDQYPFSKKKFGQHNGDALAAAAGPIGRTVKDLGGVVGDIVGSIVGSQHGVAPAFLGKRHITQHTVDQAMKFVPLINAFYTRGLVENYVTPSIRELAPKR